jgi:Holliday junction resolvasome RuvABC endonuclease subunit
VDQYAPTVLAYEESVYVQQTSSMLLRSVEREIRRTALTERLRTLAYTPAYVRQHICGDPWSTKHMVAARLAERFPELHRYRTGQSARSERYWLIVAVADLEARDQSDTGPLGRTA